MYEYVHVYIILYYHIYIYIYVYVYIYLYIYVYIFFHTDLRVSVSVCFGVCMRLCVCVRICVEVYVSMYISICAYTHVHTYTCVSLVCFNPYECITCIIEITWRALSFLLARCCTMASITVVSFSRSANSACNAHACMHTVCVCKYV